MLLNQPRPNDNRCRRSHNMSLQASKLVIVEENKVGTFDLNLVVLDSGDCSGNDFKFARLEDGSINSPRKWIRKTYTMITNGVHGLRHFYCGDSGDDR